LLDIDIFFHAEYVGQLSIVMFQLHSKLSLFIVFMLVPLTNVSCFQLIVVSIALILSYTAFLLGAVPVTQSQLAA
jgi:hypothetical protein